MTSFIAFALSLGALLLPLAVAAQNDLLASQAVRPVEFTTVLADAPAVAENTDLTTASTPASTPDRATASTPDRASQRRVLRVRGTWSLSDGPLTIEVLDGLNRSLVRLVVPATDAETLGLPAPALAAGTYTVRVRDARGAELHRQRVTYLTR